MIRLDQIVLKGVNWVHNTNIGATFLGNWSFVSLRNLWISVFDVVLLKVELEIWFLQFLSLNLPENCGFHQNLQFSSKSAVFIKLHGFHQNHSFCQNPRFCHFSLSFQEDNLKTKIGILCETKDHLPRKVTPIFSQGLNPTSAVMNLGDPSINLAKCFACLHDRNL